MSSFHFYRLNQFKVFSLDVRSVQVTYLPKFLATSDVRYCVLKPIVRHSAGQPGDRYIEEKQTELVTENK